MATQSRYRGNDEKCPHCGVTYGNFKTGLTYADIYLWFCSSDSDPSTWRYKRRHTILGKWHEHKKQQWNAHTSTQCPEFFCPGDALEGLALEGVVEGVPF